MTNNTQLPAEVVKKIEKDSKDYAAVYPFPGSLMGYKYAATEYATKLHEWEQMAERRTIEMNKHFQCARDEAYNAKKLLEKVIDRHEGGLLPDRLLYLEI